VRASQFFRLVSMVPYNFDHPVATDPLRAQQSIISCLEPEIPASTITMPLTLNSPDLSK